MHIYVHTYMYIYIYIVIIWIIESLLIRIISSIELLRVMIVIIYYLIRNGVLSMAYKIKFKKKTKERR